MAQFRCSAKRKQETEIVFGVIVFAAGNLGPRTNTVSAPSIAKNVRHRRSVVDAGVRQVDGEGRSCTDRNSFSGEVGQIVHRDWHGRISGEIATQDDVLSVVL